MSTPTAVGALHGGPLDGVERPIVPFAGTAKETCEEISATRMFTYPLRDRMPTARSGGELVYDYDFDDYGDREVRF